VNGLEAIWRDPRVLRRGDGVRPLRDIGPRTAIAGGVRRLWGETSAR
jgi:hypothetical protein